MSALVSPPRAGGLDRDVHRLALRAEARPLTGDRRDYDALMNLVGSARVVLLGEATHGTREFHRERARITMRLIAEHGFSAVAIEGDVPDAHRVHRFLAGDARDADPEQALRGFRRFPTWMWRNADMVDFLAELRAFNDTRPPSRTKVGFYGLDLYSLGASMDAVVRSLDLTDPPAAARARWRYEALRPFGSESQDYGQAVLLGVREPCRRRIFEQLAELRRDAGAFLRHDGLVAEDERFLAEQNATLLGGAEAYYRTLFAGQVASWNLRDRHMADTLESLMAHLDRNGASSRVVVWAHNSHVGDARATDMGARGELTLGQLLRERHGRDVRSVGFTTFDGTVTAARHWGGEARQMLVRPAAPGSHEALLHAAGAHDALLCPLAGTAAGEALAVGRGERAIGVIYDPAAERRSQWFRASPSRQFDALVHLDRTSAVQPLDRARTWELSEPPETHPIAL